MIAAGSAPAATGDRDTGACETPLECLERIFEVVAADRPELLRHAHELRYEVYCIERGFEDRSQHPDGIETDEFDERAVHSLLVHRASGAIVGTVRLVLAKQDAPGTSFAIQRVCNHPLLRDWNAFPVTSMAEISRFSISKKFRRRADDTFYGSGEMMPGAEAQGRRKTPPMRLGLMQAIVSMSAELGLTHWCAVMEPTLLRILAASGIHFEPLGPMVDYHGRRQPCYAPINTLLTRLRDEQPDVWDIVTKEGSSWDRLCQAWSFADATHADA